MSAAWTVADFKYEMDAACMLLQARPHLGELKEQLKNQMKHKLSNMGQVDANKLVQLYDTLKECSLPQDVVGELSGVLDQLALGVNDGATSKFHAVPQQCDHFFMYLTEGDVQQLEKVSMWQGTTILAARMKKLGIKGMKESTKKVATALLLYHEQKKGNTMPTGDSIYVLSQQMMHALASSPEQTPVGVPPLAVFPAHPDGLSKDHYKASYGQHELPLCKDFPGLAQLVRYNTPVRSTSKMVTVKNAERKVEAEKQMVPAGGCDPAMAMMNMMCQFMRGGMNQEPDSLKLHFLDGKRNAANPAAGSAAPATVPALPAPVPDTTSHHLPLALDDAEKDGQPNHSLQNGQAPKDDEKSLETFEKEAFQKLAAKDQKKAAKGGGMKRPAAKMEVADKSRGSKPTNTKTEKTLKLGCKKCRGSVNGCTQCRNPGYKGQRMDRAEWVKIANKFGYKWKTLVPVFGEPDSWRGS